MMRRLVAGWLIRSAHRVYPPKITRTYVIDYSADTSRMAVELTRYERQMRAERVGSQEH